MQECGVLIPVSQSAEEEWMETLRVPVEEMGRGEGGRDREVAAKRKREEGDSGDVALFGRYFDSEQYKEVERVAGMGGEKDAAGAAAVGVGGGVIQAENFLVGLMKKFQKGAEDRLMGTVLGRSGEEREVLVEGGPVGRLGEWVGAERSDGARVPTSAEVEVT